MSDVPEWSGQFWVTAEGGTGFISVHDGDERFHRPPDGWILLEIIRDEIEQAEVYRYVRRG